MIVPHVDVPHFDYLKFRLFLLSLLWRMGVSKLEFFEDVNLGGKHEKALRLALMSENSLDAEQYSCALIGVLIDGTFSPDLILRPKRVLGPDLHGYGIVIGGMLFQFLVMSHPPPAIWAEFCISTANRVRIPFRDVRVIPFLSKFVDEIGVAMRKRSELRGNS
jgi:hypothetical protein